MGIKVVGSNLVHQIPVKKTDSGGGGGGSSVTVDSELSLSSENPVQNKVITEELNKKAEVFVANITRNTETTLLECDKTYNELVNAITHNKNVIGIVNIEGNIEYMTCVYSDLFETVTFSGIFGVYDPDEAYVVTYLKFYCIDKENTIYNGTVEI